MKVIFYLLTLLYLLTSAAVAEERVITLSEACELAIRSHELIKIAEEDLYQAYAGVDKAFSQMLPTLTAEGSHTRYLEENATIQPDNSSTFSLKVSQPLYTGGKEWSVRRQADKKVRLNKKGLESRKEDIIFDVSVAYYNILKAEKDLEIKEAASKRAGEQTRVARARFNVGEVTKSVLLRAEAEEAGANAELAKSKVTLTIAKVKLARLTGIETDFKIAPLKSLSVPKNMESLIVTAVEKRKDYVQAKIEEDIAKEGVTYAKGNFMPSLKLDGVYSREDQNPSSSSFNGESVYGTITLTFPFFEGWLRTAEEKEAKSKVRQAELKRLNLKRDIEQDVRETFHNINAFSSIIASYERQVSFAEENYKMVFKQFTYGLATNVDVVDANTTLISAQTGLSNTIYDLQISIIGIKKKIGILLEEILENRIM
ncbi:MAG: hypothetical protein A2073_06885 [Deltaproteobacteria bacterium GWC2_42_11]|nr:MAG: hypothetical protein A2073_06885 [Deltaproteobacteria bacterium GWC2_42_11]HBO85201.1 hypothetical protein [Deltaproteobacteria bacterium]